MSFISNFNNQLATIDKAKSILLYENQKEILEELNKLENMRQDDLIEIKNIFIRLNNIIYSEKIDKMISILKYYAEKNNVHSVNKKDLFHLWIIFFLNLQ